MRRKQEEFYTENNTIIFIQAIFIKQHMDWWQENTSKDRRWIVVEQ